MRGLSNAIALSVRGRLLGRDSDESCQLRQFPPGSQKLLAWNGNGSSGKSWIVNQYGVFLNRYHYQGVQTLRLPVVQPSRGDEDERWNPLSLPTIEQDRQATR